MGISMYNITKFKTPEEFLNEAERVTTALHERGVQFSVEQKVRALWNFGDLDQGATKTYEQVRGKLPSQAKTYRTDEDLARLEREQPDQKARKAIGAIRRVKSALSGIMPDMNVVLYANDEEGARIQKSIGDGTVVHSHGFWDGSTKTDYFNASDLRKDTPFHEPIHGLIDIVRASDKKLYDRMIKDLNDKIRAMEDGTFKPYLERWKDNPEEALVEYLGDVAANKFDQSGVDEKNKSLWLNEIVNEILTFPDGKVAEPSSKISRFVALSSKNTKSTQSRKKEKVIPEPWIIAELMDRIDLKVWFQNLSDNQKLSLFRKRINSDKETHYDALLKEWWLNRY